MALLSRKPLLVAAFAPATFNRYTREVRDFCVYCERADLPVNQAAELDAALYRYFEFLYALGYAAAKGAAALHGLMVLLPEYKTQCPTARLALRGWLKLRPTVSHPPLTWPLAVAVAVRLRWLFCRTMSVAVLVQFDGLLRIGELLALRREDVSDCDDKRLGLGSAAARTVAGDFVSIRVASAKTGPNQPVLLRDPHVIAVFRQHMRTVKRGARVFPVSLPQFYKHWTVAVSGLGLSSSYTTHSLRHGGATRLLLLGHSMETVLARGRWAAVRSARIYLNSSVALLTAQKSPPSTLAHADAVATDPTAVFDLVDRVLASENKSRLCW